jgi:hypothetical protein
MNEELKKLQDQIDVLQDRLNALNNNATIPYDTGEAIKARVLSDIGVLQLSGKLGSSENQSVNEAGVAAPYNVLKSADGFVETTINGIVRYIPFYT